MSPAEFKQFLKQVEELSTEQLQELTELLAEPRISAAVTERELEESLVAAGILAVGNAHKLKPTWKPIVIQGPPLSETIIQERR